MKVISLRQGIKQIASYALPISAANLVNIIANFIGMLMVAQLGAKELAAGALAASTYITFITIAAASLYAVGILISHHKGSQEEVDGEIGNIVKNAMWLVCFMVVPIGFILWHANAILLLFGQNKDLIAIAKPYFHFAGLALLPTLLLAVISQFYTGIGNPKFIMLISIMQMPIIILLSYIFIFGKFGFPALGLAGMMCSYCIVQYLMVFVVYFFCRKNIKKYKFFTLPFTPDWQMCRKIFKLGMPIGLQFGGEIGAMTVVTYFLGFFGAFALAASQIVLQYSMFIIMITLGISQALSILISHAYGSKDDFLIKQYLISALFILGVVFLFVWAAFLFFPHQLVQIFVGKQNIHIQIIKLATYFFAISSVILFIDGIRNLFSGTLRGLHDSSSPMKVGVGCLWFVSLPLSYFFGLMLHGGPIILRISYGTGFLVASILLFQRIYKKMN